MKQTKSQITMLMIIGLLIFIVVGLILYLSKLAIKKQSTQNVKKIQETAIETQVVKDFVAKCVERLGKDALLLLGRQGGYLYKSQGGTTIDYYETDEGVYFVKYDGFNVAYDILPPLHNVPEYPWKTFPYLNNDWDKQVFKGYFGIETMSSLNASGGSDSIQINIEKYIDDKIAGCINNDIFKQQGLDIEIKQPATNVIIGSNDLSIESKIPIKVTNHAAKEFAEFEDFSAKIKVRLKDMHFFVKNIIKEDTANITFNISHESNNKNSFRIDAKHDVFSKDDIIIVSDEKSLLDGRVFEYRFARKNRAPALHYIKNTENLEFEDNHVITEEELLNRKKLSELKAEDPDEDTTDITITPALPQTLTAHEMKFVVKVTDGKLEDYQEITAKRK